MTGNVIRFRRKGAMQVDIAMPVTSVRAFVVRDGDINPQSLVPDHTFLDLSGPRDELEKVAREVLRVISEVPR